MNIAVVSYSFTGNNDRFAESIAKALSAEHIRVEPNRPVTNGSIALDLILQRKPAVEPPPELLSRFDLLLFVAPVWMGQVAFPLRVYLAWLKRHPKAFGFLSISGGALSENPAIAAELARRAGTAPALVLDQHIYDLLPQEPKPTREDTEQFRLNDEDCARIAEIALKEIRRTLPAIL